MCKTRKQVAEWETGPEGRDQTSAQPGRAGETQNAKIVERRRRGTGRRIEYSASGVPPFFDFFSHGPISIVRFARVPKKLLGPDERFFSPSPPFLISLKGTAFSPYI